MNTRKIALAVAAGATLMVAAPAFADNRHDNGWRGHGPRHHHNHRVPGRYYAPRPVMVAPRPYYYYAPPAPVYYAPSAPAYYSPAPVFYGRVPVGNGRVSFAVRF